MTNGPVGNMPSTAPTTPHAELPTLAEPNGSGAMLRFRERVRARTGTAELLAFRLGRERFAFDVRALDEALESPAVGPVPVGGASILAGLLRHGERSIPVFDTGRVLGVPGAPRAHVLVMRSGTRRIGLLVDEVDDVITLDLGAIKLPPFDAGDDLLLGVTWGADDLTAILDARALITLCQQRAPETCA